MMQQLTIMRHGEALFDAPDPQRTLSARGHQQAAETAHWLSLRWAGHPVRMMASPYRRAQQTALYLSDALGIPIETCSWLQPDTPLLEVIAGWDTHWMDAGQEQRWIWVSHMPLVGRLSRYFVDGEKRGYGDIFGTAEAILYEADVWAAGCVNMRDRYQPHV